MMIGFDPFTPIARFLASCISKLFFKTFLPDPVTRTGRRTMSEIRDLIQPEMLLDDLLSQVKGIPVVSDDRLRFILADGHLLVKTKISGGKERIANWSFEPL